ncbi:cytochrome b [Pusillimonas sp. MFBS29]|uniref:cytochrome b n=1 Tax=Pusillimonas sp. MFBS29 TaxID=2886690 RepID=UPI001D1044B9|nr:cytochrome b [Pusillimonas sp. MFBS29]MCC2595077.1 cytochrome b [Pusillimonas sp. MFBS29]
MTNDTPQRYGSISRIFHWGMALLILWQGMKFFDRINEGEHWVGQNLASWHVSIGALLLLLIVLRIFWAASQKNNRPVQDPATATLVKSGHFLLYACILLMPVTGILYLVGAGYGLNAFGMQLIAEGPEIPWMSGIGSTLHSPLAWLLLIMIVGHIGIALIHQFVKKDDVLSRML